MAKSAMIFNPDSLCYEINIFRQSNIKLHNNFEQNQHASKLSCNNRHVVKHICTIYTFKEKYFSVEKVHDACRIWALFHIFRIENVDGSVFGIIIHADGDKNLQVYHTIYVE